MSEYGVTSKGAFPRNADKIISDFESSMASRLGLTGYVLDSNEITGAFYEALAKLLENQELDTTTALYAGFLDTAIDEQLILLGNAKNDSLGEATSAKCFDLEIKGTDDYILVSGTRFVSENGNIYTLDANTTINQEGVLAIATSIAKGTGSGSLQGQINQLETPNSDVFSVENLTDVADGADEETFDNFRERLRVLFSEKGGSTTDAIKSELLTVDDVESANVYENDEQDDLDIGGTILPPGSILVVVTGGAGQDIAQKIHDTKAAGIPTFGEEVYQVTSTSGQVVNRKFDYGIKIRIFVKIESSELQIISEELKDKIEEDYYNYINNFLETNDNVDFDVMESIVFKNYEINNNIVTVTIGKTSGDLESEDIEIEFNETSVYQLEDTEFVNMG